jgi:hypothetical protein
MKPTALSLLVSFCLWVLASCPCRAAEGSERASSAAASFSAEDFDWREMVPLLFEASTLPGEQGVKAVLESSKVLRAYVAKDVRRECKPGNDRCDSSRVGFTPDGEVTRRIDGIVREGISHQHKSSFVDYRFERQPFPFSGIAALRSDRKQDAYLVLQFSDHAYSVAQLQAKYGPPNDTDIYQQYSVFKYKMADSHYISSEVFEVNPVDGMVMKVAISVKARKKR